MSPGAGDAPRFTALGSRAFDAWMAARLSDLTRDVADALGDTLVALWLGGGYGRGEGGVVGPAGAERPYNDLDLVIVVRGRARVASRLHAISRRHESRLGIAVDFSRPLTTCDIERWEHRLRWHDLYHGHLVLAGDPGLLAKLAPAGIAGSVPPGEASRLLLNRGAGLLWARRVLGAHEIPPDPDFVRRNAYKAFLSVGDAHLIASRCVAAGHGGRLELLGARRHALPGDRADEIVSRYAEAIAFKFAPDRSGPEGGDGLLASAIELWSATFLHVESLVHGIAWPTLAGYARWRGPREPLGPARRLRCLVSNLRHGILSARSPRERLYRELPALLAEPMHQAGWDARSARFLDLWRGVND